MTDREQIEAARAAKDEMTPGQWEYTDGVIWVATYDQYGEPTQQMVAQCGQNDAPTIVASPALMRRVEELEAWQREAVEWLDREREHKRLVLRRIDISEKYKQLIIIPEISKLEALIAQAKTEEERK